MFPQAFAERCMGGTSHLTALTVFYGVRALLGRMLAGWVEVLALQLPTRALSGSCFCVLGVQGVAGVVRALPCSRHWQRWTAVHVG